MILCKKCFDWLLNMRETLPGFEWGPHVHCHHEEEKPKKKCWCEGAVSILLTHQIEPKNAMESVRTFYIPLSICPGCGRRMG